MKKITRALCILTIITLGSISQQSCSSNPEGAFTEEEKNTQDSSDSTSQANDFELLMQQDSAHHDSSK